MQGEDSDAEPEPDAAYIAVGKVKKKIDKKPLFCKIGHIKNIKSLEKGLTKMTRYAQLSRNATQRNATQRNATQRNATQRRVESVFL